MKTSYPELRGRVVKITAYSPIQGCIEVEGICAGVEYDKGITIVSPITPGRKLYCLNRSLVGRVIGIPDKATYRRAFHAVVKAVQSGHLDINQFFIDIDQPLAFHVSGAPQCAFE